MMKSLQLAPIGATESGSPQPITVETDDLVRLWVLRVAAHFLRVARETPGPRQLTGHRRTRGSVTAWSDYSAGALCELIGIRKPEGTVGREAARRTIGPKVQRRLRTLERKLSRVPWPDAIDLNARQSIRDLGVMLGLNEEEKLCLCLVLFLRCADALNLATDILGCELKDMQALEVVAVVTALPLAAVQVVFAGQSRLMACQLIRLDHDPAPLAQKFHWVSRGFPQEMMQPGFDPFRALRDRIQPAPAPLLTWGQFSHLGDLPQVALSYVRQALAEQKCGVNLLLHGEPGVGKTEFSRALAHELGVELFEVSSQDEDGDPLDGGRRLQALRLLHGFAAKRRCLVVFDEIEDVFPRPHPFFGGPPVRHKGWLNRVLENNPTITIWVTNAVGAIDPAFVRRFDLTFELKRPPSAVREAQLRRLPVALPDAVIATMAACAELSPAVVSRAAGVVAAIQTELPAGRAAPTMELIVNETLRAQGHRPLKTLASADSVYDPAYINADFDPAGLVGGLREARSARLCLYGPPGTGKTAYAQWLARQLGRQILIKRASDLLSCYIGEAEKNIAGAFGEAAESGAVLLIDEVDSFLQERAKALRSWEVTQVNEFLTQLEQFEGIFIASTNLVEGLDAASLRRFDLKAKFDYLKAAQAAGLLAAHLAAAGLAAAGPEEQRQLESLENLTPGDYAAVARQHRFRPLATAAAWVAALEAECSHKPSHRCRIIGFKAVKTS